MTTSVGSPQSVTAAEHSGSSFSCGAQYRASFRFNGTVVAIEQLPRSVGVYVVTTSNTT